MSIHQKLESVERVEKILATKKNILLNQAMHSTHPTDIIKANNVLQNIDAKEKGNEPKSYIIDPYQFNAFLGYKDKPYSLTYGMLRKISYAVPVIRSIVGTRIDQIAAFCEPQKDRYSMGFVIRKKQNYFNVDTDESKIKINREDAQNIEKLTEFILNCGVSSESFAHDDFDVFVRKIMNDSLSFDQMTFEVVRNNFGKPHSFLAVDAATIRIAESMNDVNLDERNIYNLQKPIKGYYPNHVQIKDSAVVNEYYPWELCFGIRNPTTNIYSNGYGVSEEEILINTITSMLWSDEYNRRFFSQGSAPKGLLKIKSGTNLGNGTLAQFRQQWQSMMAGVYNSWKTPILEGDVDWIDLQKNNRDMEFGHWQEYLIKISCAVFRIDPAEINFPLSGGSEQKALFEGNNEARLKHSKDKGLYPLLKFLQRKINKFLIQQLDPRYEFVFCGLDVDDPAVELDNDIKMMSNFMTINEIRIKRGLKSLSEEQGGNIIANAIWMQNKQATAMLQQQEASSGGGQVNSGQSMPYNEGEYEPEEENPIQKAFENYMKTSLVA